MFKGILIEKDEAGYRASVKDIDEGQLPEGEVTVRVSHSTLAPGASLSPCFCRAILLLIFLTAVIRHFSSFRSQPIQSEISSSVLPRASRRRDLITVSARP